MSKELKPLFFRPSEAAVLIGASRSKVYEMISKGELASIRIGGGLLRIPAASLDRLVEQALTLPDDQNGLIR